MNVGHCRASMSDCGLFEDHIHAFKLSSATDHYDRSSGALYTCWAYLYFVADL